MITRELVDWLREQKIMIATPLYGGMCTGEFHMSCLRLNGLLKDWGIRHSFKSRYGESLITRGRNKMAHQFLKSDCTHLLFIDSDIGFKAADVVQMLALSRDTEGILGAPYAKKQIHWERIASAAYSERQIPMQSMPKLGGLIVANFLTNNIDIGIPQPVRHVGTGFMLAPRYVFERLYSKGLVQSYALSSDEKAEMACDRLTAFFEARVVEDSYPSEDWYFCDRWRESGGTVWLCPWMITTHVGQFNYEADISAIASAGESL